MLWVNHGTIASTMYQTTTARGSIAANRPPRVAYAVRISSSLIHSTDSTS